MTLMNETKQQQNSDAYAHLSSNWTDSEGNHQGGQSCGIGFTIAWQRGPLNENGRNGAFLIEVLEACEHQLRFYQNSKFACAENGEALERLRQAITALQSRRSRRQEEGTLGTHKV